MKELTEAFGKFVFSMVLAIFFGLYNAWLFMDLWNWFVSPSLGVGQIGVALSYGLGLVFSWPTTYLLMYANQEYENGGGSMGTFGRAFVVSFAHTFVWLIGYVVANNFM